MRNDTVTAGMLKKHCPGFSGAVKTD